MIEGLRNWWQAQTGEEDTPFDGEAPAWVFSMIFHMIVLLTIAFLPLFWHQQANNDISILSPVDEDQDVEIEPPEEFAFDDRVQEDIGALSFNGPEMAFSEAPVVAEVSVAPSPVEVTPSEVANIEINHEISVATGLHFNENHTVRGFAGAGETGAVGAIDRITHEILLSLEERKTLVVWLFDQSGSLNRQRRAIHDRFDRIHKELGVIEESGNQTFAQYQDADKPLLSSVVAFGQNVSLRTSKPTDDVATLKQAVEGIEQDDSGVEKVFSSIYMAANEYKDLRVVDSETREPKRNVMIVVFTDEIGDDQEGLEHTIEICRRYEMPVYVVGVPAPFGRKETMVKWVDPDPEYDQTPQWGRVNQGPESILPERLNLHFANDRENKDPLDSGFGPFALTRLCYSTGGIYFAVHPNRNVNRSVSRNETVAFSAHMEHFFDPEIMRKYRPDYVSQQEYMQRLAQNKARQALVKAAQMSWLTPMDNPETRFVRKSEAELANALTEAQKEAAKLEPKVESLYQVLKLGEADRPRENTLRWQAGYDLAMGRVLAIKARTEAYNGMLAMAKRGMNFKKDKNNTWTLKPADAIEVGSAIENSAERAKMYLQRVIDEHPGTPWALLAKRELETPIGWTWDESFTDLAPPRMGGGGGNAGPGRDDKPVMLKKGPPKRRLPKL